MSGSAELTRAARRCGISANYTDASGIRQTVDHQTLAALVELLDRERPSTAVPGAIVAWDGVLPQFVDAHAHLEPSRLTLRSEDGRDLGPVTSHRGDDGALLADEPLPYGMHELLVDGQPLARVIAAPSHANAPSTDSPPRPWGVFAPAYAIRDDRDRPAGDITALEGLGLYAGGLGASALATLPMLAELASDDGGDPGQRPYSPLSRMFWNEAYLDLARLPELGGATSPVRSPAGGTAAGSHGQTGAGATGAGPGGADLARLASSIRPALDTALRRLRRAGGERLSRFEAYVAARPELVRYARFRAAVERSGPDVARWPASWRAGRIGAGEVVPSVERRHCYAQWAMDEQLASTSATLATAGVGLVMDLPIGCSGSGFDPWAFPDVYVRGLSIGAPPDIFFRSGQDWGFPPPHPDNDRKNGYPVLRACLAHNLQHASVLRIDHVIGWSRLWCIPAGMPAAKGAYVRYPFEELLAVANLEAWRHSARLVGEDLGTVERGLRAKLAKRDVAGMSVAVFDLSDAPARRLRPRPGSVAYVDTHDTATFAAWFDGSDIKLRADLGLLNPAQAAAERATRQAARDALVHRLVPSATAGARARERGSGSSAGGIRGASRARGLGAGGDRAPLNRVEALDVLGAVLAELGASDAYLVLVAVEDLWAELDPQNVPGTTLQHANFSRRLAHRVEELAMDERACALLATLDTARRTDPRRAN